MTYSRKQKYYKKFLIHHVYNVSQIMNNGQPRICGNTSGQQGPPNMMGSSGAGPPNVNLNMKIQISAQAPGQTDLMSSSNSGQMGQQQSNVCFPGEFSLGGPQLFDDEDVL